MTDGPSFRIFAPHGDSSDSHDGSPNADASRTRRERDLDRVAGAAEPRTVDITLGQMVPLLMDAAQKNRVWLSDFADESVRIDADLYEVLLAYQRLRDRHAA